MKWCFLTGHNWEILDKRTMKATRRDGAKVRGIVFCKKCSKCNKEICYLEDLNRTKYFLSADVYKEQISKIDNNTNCKYRKVL